MGFRTSIGFGLAFALSLGTIAPAAEAQGSGDGFLFRAPVGDLRLHGGFTRATAGSDLFSYTRELLTLDRGDFDAGTVGLDLGIWLTPRVDLVLGGSYANRVAASEFRDWVDNRDRPIEQTTEFQRVPLLATGKVYLTPRGQRIGSFAWVPAPVAPYVGVGAGAMWYRFRQTGDFIDFNWDDLPVVSMTIESSGWSPAAQGVAGVDVTILPRLALIGEARYLWSRADLDPLAFEDFQPIDLSGLSASVGLSLRF